MLKISNYMDKRKIVASVTDIARRAGVAILDIYDNPDEFGVETKADDSPLTRADRKANQIICDALEQLDPKFPIISEENKAIPYEERRHFDRAWLVDPLDGTKEFIKRNGEFTVNIALIHGEGLEMGVVYAPVLDEMYFAVKGEGAWMEKGGEKVRLEAPAFSMSDPGLKVVCSRSHLNDDTQAFVDQLKEPDLVPKGSSLKFLLLAQGKAHLYPRLAPTMEWDTGAAQMILEEAGGKVMQHGTENPLVYNKENLLNPKFIAYAKEK